MTTAQASRFHEDNLEFNLVELANNATNPSKRAISYLREKWIKENHGSFGGEDMYSAIQKYASNSESTIKVECEGHSFAIVVITPFMKRIHKAFQESKEVVFVDTTSHVDHLNTAVTPLLCAGPAGAAPLGIILTSSQDEKSYVSGK